MVIRNLRPRLLLIERHFRRVYGAELDGTRSDKGELYAEHVRCCRGEWGTE